jgi:hypothetical protein
MSTKCAAQVFAKPLNLRETQMRAAAYSADS